MGILAVLLDQLDVSDPPALRHIVDSQDLLESLHRNETALGDLETKESVSTLFDGLGLVGRSDLAGGETRTGMVGYFYCPQNLIKDTIHIPMFLSELR